MTNLEILRKYFGFESFKDIQEVTINNLLEDKNTLCLMPTGGGKSIIYQVAGLKRGKMTIVISPLLALMKQQHKRLLEQGLNVLSYNSSLGDLKAQFSKIRASFQGSQLPHFLFVSPEKILSDGYLEYLLKMYRSEIGLIVIDEAHCISQWGHTFRPAYKTIPIFLKNIFGEDTKPPLLCLTATLNPIEKAEICSELNIKEKDIFKSKQLLRDNLHLKILNQVENNAAKKEQLVEILERYKDQKIIVYTHIKSNEYGTREMSASIENLGYNCHYFDADMKDAEKLDILEKFEKGDIKIIFATSAFGMGIDIPDIRVVVHYLVPESIEQYYQEVGRAGRDGQAAFGYLLHSDTNFKIKRDLIKKSLLKPTRIMDIFTSSIKPTITRRAKENSSIEDFEQVFALSRMDIKEDNSEMIIFLALLKRGLIKLRGKGIQFLDCFENVSKNGEFEEYNSATKNKSVSITAKKVNQSIEKVNFNLFSFYNASDTKLVKVPINVLNYTVEGNLTNIIAEEIHVELSQRVEYRLEGFEKLKSFIIEGKDSKRIIGEHLGI